MCPTCRRSRASTPRFTARCRRWSRCCRCRTRSGSRDPALRISRPVVRIHGRRARRTPRRPARRRTIVAHLGSGASLCAMHGLESVATTMGFSALDGLMMGTRSRLDRSRRAAAPDADRRTRPAAAHPPAVPRVRPARVSGSRRARRPCSRSSTAMRARARRSSSTCGASCARSVR
jgi:hypothetical protein